MSGIKAIEFLAEKYYQYLPVIFQNVLISLKGYAYKKERFGKYYEKELELLRQYESATLDDLKKLQRDRLLSFLTFAKNKSRFYKDIEFDSSAESCEGILSSIPILRKETLKANLDKVKTLGTHDKTKVYWTSTSGTTGSAMSIAFTTEDLQKRFAAISRQLDQVDVDFGDACARFSARTIIRGDENVKSISRKNWFNNEEIYSSFFISRDYAKLYLDTLGKQRPTWATGFPSSFYALAKLYSNDELQKLGIRAIMPTGETLTDECRQVIENSFDARVVNQYGSAEGSPIITECEHGNLHCNLETGVFELLPTDDNSEVCRLIVTSFTTHAFPLIRYDIGDAVEICPDQNCPCGYQGTIVNRILGRLDDFVHSPQRGWVGRLGGVFKMCPDHVNEAQLAQISEDTIELRYSSDKRELSAENITDIKHDLSLRLGDKMKVQFVRLNKIPRSANGKFRTVVGLNGKAP